MADADTAASSSSTIRLQVAPARQEESGQGIARMPRTAFQKLGITEGDVVEIVGKRSTAAIALLYLDAPPPAKALDDLMATGMFQQVKPLQFDAG